MSSQDMNLVIQNLPVLLMQLEAGIFPIPMNLFSLKWVNCSFPVTWLALFSMDIVVWVAKQIRHFASRGIWVKGKKQC